MTSPKERVDLLGQSIKPGEAHFWKPFRHDEPIRLSRRSMELLLFAFIGTSVGTRAVAKRAYDARHEALLTKLG